MAATNLRVVIVDDNPLLRRGAVDLLGTEDDMTVVAEHANGAELIDWLDAGGSADVVVLDARMPVLDGIGALAHIAGRARVLMASSSDDPAVVQSAVRAGADGYLIHGHFAVTELASAVRQVSGGDAVFSPKAAQALAQAIQRPDRVEGRAERRLGLSEREIDVVELVVQGWPNREIARRLYINEKTVKNHLNRIYAKLHANSRAEAIATWLGTRPEAGPTPVGSPR